MSEHASLEQTVEHELPKEQPKDEKKASYTYWVNNDPNFFGNKGIDIAPKKLDENKPDQFRETEDAKKAGHSAWNSAGTWEEKSLKGPAFLEFLRNYIPGYTTKDGKLEISEVRSVTGEGRLILSRGKKRVGFEINVELEYKGLGDLEGAAGTISYKEFQEDGDHEHDVYEEGEEKAAEGRKAAQGNLKELAELLLATLQKLKE